jgi:hypothetical protein
MIVEKLIDKETVFFRNWQLKKISTQNQTHDFQLPT